MKTVCLQVGINVTTNKAPGRSGLLAASAAVYYIVVYCCMLVPSKNFIPFVSVQRGGAEQNSLPLFFLMDA